MRVTSQFVGRFISEKETDLKPFKKNKNQKNKNHNSILTHAQTSYGFGYGVADVGVGSTNVGIPVAGYQDFGFSYNGETVDLVVSIGACGVKVSAEDIILGSDDTRDYFSEEVLINE